MDKYLITGGPGSGKTCLLESLKELNYNCSEEVSRQLIIEEVESGSTCLPWLNLSCFAEKALERMITRYKAAPNDRVTFFDRGIPDIIAYLKVAGVPIAPAYFTALEKYRYNDTVFVLPPWRDIYVNDSERWQTYQEAEEIYAAISETYQSLGFKLIELSRSSINERLLFVLNHVQSTVNKLVY